PPEIIQAKTQAPAKFCIEGLDTCSWLLEALQSLTIERGLRTSYRREKRRLLTISFHSYRFGNHLKICEHHQDGKTWILIPEGNQGSGITSFISCFKKIYVNLRSSIPHPPPFVDNALVCAWTQPSPQQSSNSISATLLKLEFSESLHHPPHGPPITPATTKQSTLQGTLSASAPAFTPQRLVTTPGQTLDMACAKPLHFQGCSNSDNDLDSPPWGKNLGYISGPEINPLDNQKKLPSNVSEDEWVTDRGSDDDEDWHAYKEVNKKKKP
ncbi:unnamed protein product, partial [Cuscuta campestris]